MTATAAVEIAMFIPATPEEVFSYLTDPFRYANWIGSQATFDPVPGDVYHIHLADGFQAAGTFIEVLPPHRVSFTWGFADNESART